MNQTLLPRHAAAVRCDLKAMKWTDLRKQGRGYLIVIYDVLQYFLRRL